MDPNGDGDLSDGVDGWRLDVASEVGTAWGRVACSGSIHKPRCLYCG